MKRRGSIASSNGSRGFVAPAGFAIRARRSTTELGACTPHCPTRTSSGRTADRRLRNGRDAVADWRIPNARTNSDYAIRHDHIGRAYQLPESGRLRPTAHSSAAKDEASSMLFRRGGGRGRVRTAPYFQNLDGLARRCRLRRGHARTNNAASGSKTGASICPREIGRAAAWRRWSI